MKVSSKAPTVRYVPAFGAGAAAIEFADPKKGGNSSYAEKNQDTEKSVRLSWWGQDGKFDPISSAELPYWALLDLVEACAASDFISTKDAATLIKALATSIERSASA